MQQHFDAPRGHMPPLEERTTPLLLTTATYIYDKLKHQVPVPYLQLTDCKTSVILDGVHKPINYAKSKSDPTTFAYIVKATTGKTVSDIFFKYTLYQEAILKPDEIPELVRDIENYNLACIAYFQAVYESIGQ